MQTWTIILVAALINEVRAIAAIHGAGPLPQLSFASVGLLMWSRYRLSWPVKVQAIRGELHLASTDEQPPFDTLVLTIRLSPRLGRQSQLGRAFLVPLASRGAKESGGRKARPIRVGSVAQSHDRWEKGRVLTHALTTRLLFHIWRDRKSYPYARLEIEADGRWCKTVVSLGDLEEQSDA